MSDSLWPHGLYSSWNSLGQNAGVGSLSLHLPNPGIEPGLPSCRWSLPAEPQGKPKYTGVGSLSLLQRIFRTQESNQDRLHCRQILYQLIYQGSPSTEVNKAIFQKKFSYGQMTLNNTPYNISVLEIYSAFVHIISFKKSCSRETIFTLIDSFPKPIW